MKSLDEKLFKFSATAAEQRVSEFTALNIANTIWSFATVNRSNKKASMALARAAERRISEFTEQGISNTAWAFATVNESHAKLFAVLARAAEQHMSKFHA